LSFPEKQHVPIFIKLRIHLIAVLRGTLLADVGCACLSSILGNDRNTTVFDSETVIDKEGYLKVYDIVNSVHANSPYGQPRSQVRLC
jgi:hypothetical protein